MGRRGCVGADETRKGWLADRGSIWRSLNRCLQLGRHAMFGDRENPMPDHSPAVSATRELATKIVAAYVRRHQIGADQIGALISNVHEALLGLNKPKAEAAGPRI